MSQRRQRRTLAVGAVGAVGAVALLVGCSSTPSRGTSPTTASRAARVATTLAVGTRRVGTVTETFVDRTRPTAANGDVPGHASRTLVTTVFYPATGAPGGAATRSARPDRSGGPYPLVVFAHGFGSSGEEYHTLLERWASAGFVVAAPRFPLTNDRTPGGPNAADYVNQPGDIRFVITSVLAAAARPGDALSGLVDRDAIGIAGHSLGGITTLGLAANTCCRDSRVEAAIVMSGDTLTFPRGTFDDAHAPPILFVHGTADGVVSYESSVDAFNAAPGPKGLLTIEGGDHSAPVDPSGKAFAGVVRATTDFLDTYLKRHGDGADLIAADAVRGVTRIVFDAAAGSRTTVPTTPTTVGLVRHAEASATTGLTNGRSVTIHWSNYTPGKSVNIVECSQRETLDAAACDLKHAVLLHPDPTGTGSITIDVLTGPVGTGVCDAAHDTCALVVNDGGSFDPAASVRIPIAFAAS